MENIFPPEAIAAIHRQVWGLVRYRWDWGTRLGHGPDHAERVYANAMFLCEKENIDPLAAGAACYLIDAGISDAGGRENHIDWSLALATDVIQAVAPLRAVSETILECIRWHEAELKPPPSLCTAVYLVRDADTLDRLGVTGIRMTLTYGQWMNRPLFNPQDPLCTSNREPVLDAFTFDYLRYLRVEVAKTVSIGSAQPLATAKCTELNSYFSLLSSVFASGDVPTYDEAFLLLQRVPVNR